MSNSRHVAVVAGGSAGIGRATASRLASEGCDIVILARGKERLDAAVAQLENCGVQALGLVCDVGDAKSVDKARDTIVKQFGTIDVWVNCAMATVFGPFDSMSDTEFRAVMDTTFMGQVNGMRAALSIMKKNGHGSIINVGSGLSYRSVPLQSAYCAAKHAINGFTASVRSELIHDGYDGISVSLVQLPAVNTPQFDWARAKLTHKPRPAAPVYQPDVAVDGIMKALETGAREMIVGTSAAQLVFGQMVVPNYLDHKMADAGWTGQHSDERLEGDRSGNLMEPVDGDYAAGGSWDNEASSSGLTIDGDVMRRVVFGGAAILGLGVGALLGNALARKPSAIEHDDGNRKLPPT